MLEQCVLNLMQDALDKVKTAAVQDLLKMWCVAATAAYIAIRSNPPLMAA